MKKVIYFGILLILCIQFLNAIDKFDAESVISSKDIIKAVAEAKADSLISQQDFEECIKDFEKIEGMFTLYRNNEDGTVYFQILPDQFGKIFLCNMTRQTGDAYMFDASSMMWNFPFFFKKINNRVQLIQKNLKFRAEEPALKRAVENSITNSIIASSNIVCKPQTETGAILIKASDLFLKDMANVESRTDNRKMKYNFDNENSYFDKIKSFPLNTEIDVVLHYQTGKWQNIYTLPDSRSMIHRYHYSLAAIPASNYKPRLADDRLGHFTTIYQDYSNLLTEDPYVRYINRWHIEKEDPKAKISKAKIPIVFWLENTIPVEFREACRKGLLLWNDAFEKIGITDAIVVKEMPDNADWDPADSRYNTIRWFIQPGGGYAVGPSHANPFTGELYDADVRISVDFMRYFFLEYEELINPGGWVQGLQSARWEETDLNNYYEGDAFASGLSQQMAFGWNILQTRGIFQDNPVDMKEFVDQGIIALVVHEVGHTLGLRHNFKASTYYTSEELQDKKFTSKHGISGSVMDYTPLNLAPINGKQGDYFQVQLGTWDYWVMEYAYSIFDEKKEAKELEKIARKCTKPYLDYGTDEDTYGYSSRGVDPLCNMFDLGSDPIGYYEERIELANEIWKDIPKNFEKKGKSYKKLRSVFGLALREYRNAANNVSKYVGGLYSHRDHIGDPDGRPPFEVVPAAEQRRALNFLTQNILAENAFNFDPELLNKLVLEKMGKFTGSIWEAKRQDYPIHTVVAGVQAIILSHLYDPIVLGRLHDNSVKFIENTDTFTMAEMFLIMKNSIWNELADNNNINSYRRELQRIHLYRLTQLILEDNNTLPKDAVSLARTNLKEIQEQISEMNKTELDIITLAHLDEMYDNISAVLNAQFQINE